MKIYIDHFPEQEELAKTISSRLKSINSDISVKSFYNIEEISSAEEQVDVQMMKDSDIIIPIITASYLAENTDEVNNTLQDISIDKDKSLFPFIYNEANWSSKSWIVKSKVFPHSGKTYTDLSNNDKSRVINDLVKTVGNIISQKLSISSLPQKTTEKEKITDKNHIFISHSHSDADFAELLKMHLEKQNIKCWMDSERLKIGQDWREEIDSGISDSKAVIVIMSPEARKSEYVTYEWAYAWGKGIKIYPLMLL